MESWKDRITPEGIIQQIRTELDKIYTKYEGDELIENGLFDGFEDIIVDYYESVKPM